jgi:L-fuconolactonase
MYHPQLDDLLGLARDFPGTTMILNHAGTPLGVGPYALRREQEVLVWRAKLAALAACPNVVVKIGGFGTPICGFGFHLRDAPPGSVELAAAWRPYIDYCIEAFGARRCMLESNFPVDRQSCGYTQLWNAFKRVTAGCSADARHALFAGTAARVYRLDLAPERQG